MTDVLVSTLHLSIVGFPMATRVRGNMTPIFTTQYLYQNSFVVIEAKVFHIFIILLFHIL